MLNDKGQTQLGKRFLSTWMSIHIKKKPWHGQAAWADWQSSMIQIDSIVLLQIQSWQQAWLLWKWTDVGMTFAAVLADTSLFLSELKTRLGLHMGDQYEILGGVLNIWRMSSQSHERMLAYQSKELRPCWSGYQSELDGKVKYEVSEELFGVRQCRSTVSYRSVLVHKEPESLTNPWPVAVQNESETLLHDQIWIRRLHLPFLCHCKGSSVFPKLFTCAVVCTFHVMHLAAKVKVFFVSFFTEHSNYMTIGQILQFCPSHWCLRARGLIERWANLETGPLHADWRIQGKKVQVHQIGTMVECEWKHQGDRSDNGVAIDNDSRSDGPHFPLWSERFQS